MNHVSLNFDAVIYSGDHRDSTLVEPALPDAIKYLACHAHRHTVRIVSARMWKPWQYVRIYDWLLRSLLTWIHDDDHLQIARQYDPGLHLMLNMAQYNQYVLCRDAYIHNWALDIMDALEFRPWPCRHGIYLDDRSLALDGILNH